MQTKNLINVYQDTREKCSQYTSFLKEPQTKIYNYTSSTYTEWNKPKFHNDAIINVYNKEPIDVALMMKYQKLNPLVINLADHDRPGGNVEFGGLGQEESLFRRTDYYRHLSMDMYPLRMLDVIYSPNVSVIKRDNFQMMSSFITLDFLAVCALKSPQLINCKLNVDAENFMQNKIEQIFQISNDLGYDSIVLGALGCGKYGHPTEQICSMFKTRCKKYALYFDTINFAIPDNDNYNLFAASAATRPGWAYRRPNPTKILL